MSTILNYLKGNYLISNFSFLVTVESDLATNELSHKIASYSINHNMKAKDRFFLISFEIRYYERNVIIMDFGITFKAKHLSFVDFTESNSGNLKFWSNNEQIYYIPIQKPFIKLAQKNNFVFEKDGLMQLIEILKKDFLKTLNTKIPTMLYVFGLEILQFYFQEEIIISFLRQILTEIPFIKQSFFHVKLDILSEELLIIIKKLSTAQIIFEQSLNSSDGINKKGKIRLIVNKKNGHSILENLSLTYDNAKDTPLFEIYKEEEKKEDNSEMLLNATFNLNISESQKKAKEQMVLPFMKAQNFSKEGLVELEQEDKDLEDDDEDDIDV